MMMHPANIDASGTKRFVLIVTTAAAFLSPFGISAVNIALPSIGREFLMDAILLSWVTTSYLLTSAMFLVPFGKIADLYGRKKIFTSGILLFTLSSSGCALSTSGGMLIGFRVLQGIGAAATYCVGAAILTSVFPPRELGKVFGINLAAVYVSYSMGPFLGGFLTHHLGWRTIFIINVVLGFSIVYAIFWKWRGEWEQASGERFDLTGSIIYSIALLLIMYGFSQLSSFRGLWFILPGVLSIFVFIRWETKIENPVLEISLFRKNRVFAFSNLAALINYSATFAVSFLLSLYLQYIKALTPETAGLILLPQPVTQAFFSPLAGRLSDRIEPRIVASIGMLLTAAGLFLLIFLGEKTSETFIVWTLILLGLGFALFSSPNTNAVMASVEGRLYGVASGTIGTMRMMGMVLSMGITVLIFSLYIGKVRMAPEYYPALLKCTKVAFIFFTLLCLGGVFASLSRGKVR
jgi:EmrB/QacA subfamily drug resistance transporter